MARMGFPLLWRIVDFRLVRGGMFGEPVIEDFKGRDLVDEVSLSFGGFAGVAELFGGGGGAESLVGIFQRDVREGVADAGAEGADAGRGRSLGAVPPEGQAQQDAPDLAFPDDLGDAGYRVGPAGVDRFHGKGREAERIGDGQAEAGFAVVDREDRMLDGHASGYGKGPASVKIPRGRDFLFCRLGAIR